MTKKKKPQQALAVPAKPIRVGRAPGTPVELVTNLYRIPLENRRQIFCYTNIQIEFPVADGQLAGGERVQRRPVVPRKIPKDLCRQAVNNAVAAWMANNDNNDPKVYIFDANSSTMYALFKMLELHNGSLGTRSDLEIRTNIKTTRNAIATRENVLVKFHSPSLVNVRDLIDYCAGKPPRANDQAEQALKALNIILTGEILQAPGFLGMQTKYGSCSVFQDGTKNQFPIGGGIVGERGFNVSVRLTETGPVANIANTVVAFHEPIKITELLQKRFGVQDFSRELSPQIIDGLKKELRMIQVKAIHSSIKYRIHDIGKSALEEKFDLGGETLSVSNYINQRYPNYELLFPNLPCVIDNKGRRIPLELCRIVDKQKVNRKLTGQETREFIQRAALKPETHFAAVEQNAELLCKHDQQSQDFGFKVDKNPIELTGRELPPIKLLAAKDRTLLTEGGGYKCFQAQFIKPAQLKKWALVVLVRRNERQTPNEIKRDCYRFARLYCNSARSKGITCAEFAENDLRCLPINMNDQDMVVKKKLRDEYCFLNNSGYSHAIVVLPKYKDWIYSYLQYLEVDVGNRLDKTRTCTRLSCLKADNFWNKMLGRDEQKEMPMFVSNLLLKHNTKLGGINYVLYDEQKFSIDPKDFQNFLADGYLFVSIDVCHPAPGDRLEQSVAAAVGMWNITSSKMSFCTQVRAQRKERGKEKSTVEEVKEIGIMFKEILESYIKQTSGPAKGAQKLPSHIVVLRDGVSRGQFEMVNSFELPKIKACIKDVYDKLKIKAPLLTCLIIQKRHKVRAKRKKPAKDRKGREDYNIQPGTVIDNEIVDPASLNFYLAPHKAIQGTSRAPHVYMIYDEIKFSQDSAQAMIFALSYLSPRCNKGTSIPTPVNLADLAAERGKHIVVAWNGENPQVMTAEERLKKLNTFLSTMGDANYQNTLYYV